MYIHNISLHIIQPIAKKKFLKNPAELKNFFRKKTENELFAYQNLLNLILILIIRI